MQKARAAHLPVKQLIAFHGHPNVKALHPTTLEVTTEDNLTENGDCIIGVGADRGCAGMSEQMKAALQQEGTRIKLRVLVEGRSFGFRAFGSSGLTLTDTHEIVVRKSTFLSGRTAAVRASAAALDLPREMVVSLRNPRAQGFLEMVLG